MFSFFFQQVLSIVKSSVTWGAVLPWCEPINIIPELNVGFFRTGPIRVRRSKTYLMYDSLNKKKNLKNIAPIQRSLKSQTTQIGNRYVLTSTWLLPAVTCWHATVLPGIGSNPSMQLHTAAPLASGTHVVVASSQPSTLAVHSSREKKYITFISKSLEVNPKNAGRYKTINQIILHFALSIMEVFYILTFSTP